MSETAIPAALTPDQWNTLRSLASGCAALDAITFLEVVLGTEPDPHAASAALLYDRPYGFTREMADALLVLAAWAERTAAADGETGLGVALGLVRETEARISALVPAREVDPPA